MSASVERLAKARDLISPPGKWTQNALARDYEGREIKNRRGLGDATCFCLEGALIAAQCSVEGKEWGLLRKATSNHSKALHRWNDERGRTKAEVIAALDGAIELAKVAP